MQVDVPALQMPTPSLPLWMWHAVVVLGTQVQKLSTVLSGWPSQSLSLGDEQSRTPGPTEPMQSDHPAALQVCVPALQMPTPSLPGWAAHACVPLTGVQGPGGGGFVVSVSAIEMVVCLPDLRSPVPVPIASVWPWPSRAVS